jgi:C4-dicarboxylate-specific signal transduction histidine kinase
MILSIHSTNLSKHKLSSYNPRKWRLWGQLTRGIAHEIQNPLNFVKNFSEVSQELLDEMTEEIEKGNLQKQRNYQQM